MLALWTGSLLIFTKLGQNYKYLPYHPVKGYSQPCLKRPTYDWYMYRTVIYGWFTSNKLFYPHNKTSTLSLIYFISVCCVCKFVHVFLLYLPVPPFVILRWTSCRTYQITLYYSDHDAQFKVMWLSIIKSCFYCFDHSFKSICFCLCSILAKSFLITAVNIHYYHKK